MLYELRAAEDTVAYLDTPILGYSLETEYILEVCILVTFIDQMLLGGLGILNGFLPLAIKLWVLICLILVIFLVYK